MQIKRALIVSCCHVNWITDRFSHYWILIFSNSISVSLFLCIFKSNKQETFHMHFFFQFRTKHLKCKNEIALAVINTFWVEIASYRRTQCLFKIYDLFGKISVDVQFFFWTFAFRTISVTGSLYVRNLFMFRMFFLILFCQFASQKDVFQFFSRWDWHFAHFLLTIHIEKKNRNWGKICISFFVYIIYVIMAMGANEMKHGREIEKFNALTVCYTL